MERTAGTERKANLILCVEDEPDLRADIIDELIGAGHEVVGARNGAEAFAMMGERAPDLILCDISMPVMGGYELLARVRAERPDLAAVPFVFLTAFGDRKDILAGKRSGAEDYLVKPVDYELLLATVEARIAQAERVREAAAREFETVRNAFRELPAPRQHEDFAPEGVLDLLSFGVVIVDARANILLANRFARDLAEKGHGLIIHDQLRAGSPDETRALHDLIAATAGRNPASGAASGGMAVSVPAKGFETLLVTCPLSDAPDGGADRVVVFASDAARRPASTEHVLCSLFQLTRTEAQIAHALVRGRRSSEIARELGIGQSTVAFHFRNLFQKTGTNRQVDLVALIMNALAPIR